MNEHTTPCLHSKWLWYHQTFNLLPPTYILSMRTHYEEHGFEEHMVKKKRQCIKSSALQSYHQVWFQIKKSGLWPYPTVLSKKIGKGLSYYGNTNTPVSTSFCLSPDLCQQLNTVSYLSGLKILMSYTHMSLIKVFSFLFKARTVP